MHKLEEHINKTSNTLRIVAAIPLAVGLFPIMRSALVGSFSFDGEFSVYAVVIAFGVSMQLVSAYLWKLIQKYGDPDVRLIYFYDPKKKRLN